MKSSAHCLQPQTNVLPLGGRYQVCMCVQGTERVCEHVVAVRKILEIPKKRDKVRQKQTNVTEHSALLSAGLHLKVFGDSLRAG